MIYCISQSAFLHGKNTLSFLKIPECFLLKLSLRPTAIPGSYPQGSHPLSFLNIHTLISEHSHSSSGGILTDSHCLAGEALDIYQIIELTKGSLEKRSQPGP